MLWRSILLGTLLAIGLSAAERTIDDEIQAGFKLNTKDADNLEKKVAEGKRGTPGELIRLLAWYSKQLNSPQVAEIREKRITLIVNLFDRRDVIFRAHELGCLAMIHREGDAFASKAGYDLARVALRQRSELNPASIALSEPVAGFIFPEDRAEGINYAAPRGMTATTARMVAELLLGIQRRHYEDCSLGPLDPKAYSSPLGESALEVVGKSNDVFFILMLSNFLRQGGAEIEKSGATVGWDYKALVKAARDRVRAEWPEEVACIERHEAAEPQTSAELVRVTGKDQAPKVITPIAPPYPEPAKDKKIQGTVSFDAVVGCGGGVLWVGYIGGPDELVRAAYDAVKKARYQPTLQNAIPVQVITRIDVPFKR